MNRTVPATLLAALSLGVAQQACRRAADSTHLSTVVRLRATADSLQRAIGSVDTVTFAELSNLFEADRPRIEARFRDTLDPATAAVLGNYHRALARTLPHALEDRDLFRAHLDSTRHRLGDLEHDVQNALMEEPEEITALERERHHVERLRDMWAAIDARLSAVRSEHERHRTAVDSLLNLPVTTP